MGCHWIGIVTLNADCTLTALTPLTALRILFFSFSSLSKKEISKTGVSAVSPQFPSSRDHEAAVDQLKGKANALRVEKTAHGVPTADPIGVRLTPLTALTAIRILFSLLLFFSLKIKN
ncbi:MAG: hypothetical protein DMG17_33495 [Acidobacteria bacterium]|nr:MAG: hypothetical protein DMG17_33495 [Acidobacteriota bacterium]